METNEGLVGVCFISDVTQKKRLAQSATRSREEIRALAASLLTVQDDERRRVSRELHDGLCQQLASLAFDIAGLIADTAAKDGSRKKIRALQARAVEASEDARQIAH